MTDDVTYDVAPKSAAETRKLVQRVQAFNGTAVDAYKLIDDIIVHEEGKDWFSEGSQTGHDHSIHGTIGMAAFDKLDQIIKGDGKTRCYMNIGAGKCHLIMMMRLLGIEANGCEQVPHYVERGNEIGQKYFANWVNVPCAEFQDLAWDRGEPIVYYANNLAYGEDQQWLADMLQSAATNADSVVVSTDVIPGLNGKHWTLEKTRRGENVYKARHSGSEKEFTMRVYTPYSDDTELEKLFNLKKPFASHNGPR